MPSIDSRDTLAQGAAASCAFDRLIGPMPVAMDGGRRIRPADDAEPWTLKPAALETIPGYCPDAAPIRSRPRC